MTESVKTDIPLEESISQTGASLESILCTKELQGRPSRPPDYQEENRALVALMSALADSPSTIFQTLAETILDITQCDSAGLSLLTRDGKTPDVCGHRFYWPAIAGMWNPHVGGGTPRNFGPCGDVLDQSRTLLFRHFERRYPYLLPVIPAAEECLLVPFYVAGKAVGTIWAIMHSDRREFDAEDDRVMTSLGKFASSAYQALVHIEDLQVQVAEREKAEAEVRELAKGLEAKVRRLVDANVVGIVIWNLEGTITEANEAFLRMVQYDREDLASGRVRWTDLTPVEWRGTDERAIADLKFCGIFQPFEKEYFRKDGSRVPVLLGGALFEGSGNEGVAFVLDLSEQKRAEGEIRALKDQLYRDNLALRDENVRLEERTRIARELHDTLLQTSLGALFRLGAAVESLPRDSQVKSKLDPILQLVKQGIEEGRNAIQGLRSDSRPFDLVVALSAVGQDFSARRDVDFRVSVVGQKVPLRSAIQQEIYSIGREALVNAFFHSKAKRIDLELEHTDRNLTIRVRDNGCGIDPQILDAGREGHWGLAGMQERAARIGGLLEISSSPNAGTEIKLSILRDAALRGFDGPSDAGE